MAELASQKGDLYNRFDKLTPEAKFSIVSFSSMCAGQPFDLWWEQTSPQEQAPVLVGSEVLSPRMKTFLQEKHYSAFGNYTLPSLDIGLELFCLYLENDPRHLIISFDLMSEAPVADQLDTIRGVIAKQKKRRGLTQKGVFPVKQSSEYLQRLLDLYDAYQKINPCTDIQTPAKHGTWKNIQEIVHSCKQKDKRRLQLDIKKAFQIVKNTEKGLFPGRINT